MAPTWPLHILERIKQGAIAILSLQGAAQHKLAHQRRMAGTYLESGLCSAPARASAYDQI